MSKPDQPAARSTPAADGQGLSREWHKRRKDAPSSTSAARHGQIGKVLKNFVLTAQFAVALELFQFANELGLGQATIAEVLAIGNGGSRAASTIARGVTATKA